RAGDRGRKIEHAQAGKASCQMALTFCGYCHFQLLDGIAVSCRKANLKGDAGPGKASSRVMGRHAHWRMRRNWTRICIVISVGLVRGCCEGPFRYDRNG